MRDPDRPLLTLAGLWTPATVDGVSTPTCAILTCEPSPIVAAIHDRMPVVLDDAAIDTWLDPRAPAEKLAALAQPWTRLVAARV